MVGRKKRPRAQQVGPVRFRGLELGRAEISRIRALAARHGNAGRRELAAAVCRAWGWRRPNGELRVAAVATLLCRLEERGLLKLRSRPGRARRASRDPRKPRAGRSSGLLSTTPSAVRGEDVALERVVVRPISRIEVEAWREAIERFHYLGGARLVGERLRYVAEVEGRWLALLGWGAAALKSRHRERFIGWEERTKLQRLHLVANNARFLIFPWVKVPCLASRVLSLNLRRLSQDWQERYGHPILFAETFVDVERFSGICYRAANWICLGETRGMGRRGRSYRAHGRKKALFVYPLHRRACEILSAPFPSPEISRRPVVEGLSLDVNKLPIEGEGGLVELLSGITDPRSPRGIRHPRGSVLTLAVLAALCGMRSYQAIAEWAADLPKDFLRRLGCWCHRAPSEPTFRRFLQSVDVDEVDKSVGEWLAAQTEVKALSLDGKSLRGSRDGDGRACHLLAAITHETGIVVAQEKVEVKSNEIKGAQPLLERLDLRGQCVTADAMHTQRDLARFLVEEKEADYVLIVKDNQPTLREEIESVDWGSFPPSGPNMGQGPRTDRETRDPHQR